MIDYNCVPIKKQKEILAKEISNISNLQIMEIMQCFTKNNNDVAINCVKLKELLDKKDKISQLKNNAYKKSWAYDSPSIKIGKKVVCIAIMEMYTPFYRLTEDEIMNCFVKPKIKGVDISLHCEKLAKLLRDKDNAYVHYKIGNTCVC